MVPWTLNSPPLCLSARKVVRVAFREVPVFEVREVLRLWLDGRSYRAIADLARHHVEHRGGFHVILYHAIPCDEGDVQPVAARPEQQRGQPQDVIVALVVHIAGLGRIKLIALPLDLKIISPCYRFHCLLKKQ